MNTKRVIGIIVLVLGLFLIAFSAYAKMRIGEAKKLVQEATSPLASNHIGKMLGGAVVEKAAQYDQIVLFSLVGGILLSVVGGSVIFYCKKR